MRDEYISFSVAGAIGLLMSGVMLLGVMISNDHVDVGSVVVVVALLALIRNDVRERHVSGTYQRGWFIWRRTGSIKSDL